MISFNNSGSAFGLLVAVNNKKSEKNSDAGEVFECPDMEFNLAVMELDTHSTQASLRVDECDNRKQIFLDLSGCNLVSIPNNIFPFLTQLRELDLSNNNLQGLPSDLGSLTSLETLDLRDNPKLNISDSDIREILPNIKEILLGKKETPLDKARVSPNSVSAFITGGLSPIQKETEEMVISFDGGTQDETYNVEKNFPRIGADFRKRRNEGDDQTALSSRMIRSRVK